MSIPLNTRQWGKGEGFGITRNVPVEKLEFSQQHLDQDKVDDMASKNMSSWTPPIGAEVGDKVIVEDGHHRAAAMIKKGHRTIPVKIY